MLSSSLAARLAGADTLDTVEHLTAAIGFGPLISIDQETRGRLALPDEVREARIAAGPGALRALSIELSPCADPRRMLIATATRLASRAPYVLWLVVVVSPGSSQLVIAAWSASVAAVRPIALVVDRAHVVASDVETLCALAASLERDRADATDSLVHARWVEILGRDALTRRFYRTLQQLVGRLASDAIGPGSPEERAEVALLTTSRLLFLAFLEAKGWLDGDRAFLVRQFDHCMNAGGDFHRRRLLPLFFGTLNTPPRRRASTARGMGCIPFLNGGLFAPTPVERRLRGLQFDDASLGALVGDLLSRYRFTAHEESVDLAEVAVDPEMLGRSFECLMAAGTRRDTGAFYTPHTIVERVTSNALRQVLARAGATDEVAERALLGDVEALGQPVVTSALRDLTLLDPACGSGAFLVHALDRLAALDAAGRNDVDRSALRRARLTRSIFGVDRNPTAVWLCELRLWLAVVVDCAERDPRRVVPLPNLDRNVRVGDALAAGAFGDLHEIVAGGERMRHLRERYVRSTGVRKASLARSLDAEERRRAVARLDHAIVAAVALRREALLALRARDLFGERRVPTLAERADMRERRDHVLLLRRERRRVLDGGALPFRFGVHFADVATRGGFDAVIGNPPWVRLHRIPAGDRASLRREFSTFRHAAWEAGADRTQVKRGFAAQVDLAALFVERSLALLKPGGTMALLLPAKLWRTLSGGGVRRLILDESELHRIEDWSEARALFDAAVYPSMLVADARALATDRSTSATLGVTVHRRQSEVTWRSRVVDLPIDATPGSPWLMLPPSVRAGVDRLRRAGIPLGESTVGRPLLGVKSGCNEAFLVSAEGVQHDVAQVVASDGRRGRIEAALLRPLVAGHALAAWRAPSPRTQLLWTHDASLAPLERLPPLAARWLAPWRRRLEQRTDARGRRHWWSLFRVESADPSRPRVVWGDVGRSPRASVLAAGDDRVPLNSCYVVRCETIDDAYALCALLNGPVAAAWLAALAEPARGGYRRYLGWTVSMLPLPADWPRARRLLAPLGACGDGGQPPSPAELLDASLRAYRVRAIDLAPLIAWFDT